jgi:hypothetical protein
MLIHPRYLLVSALLALSLCALSAHAQQDGLQQRMSSADFKAAGLDKLSPQELAHLDDWLRTQGKTTTRVVDASGKPVFYPGNEKRTTISTRLSGHFDGWSSQQEFSTDNGQRWKVVDPEPHSCTPTENPEVKIKPSILGAWLMYVPSCYENVHVKRVS